MPKSSKIRMKEMYDRRKSAGLKKCSFWTTEQEQEQLSIFLASLRKFSFEKEKK